MDKRLVAEAGAVRYAFLTSIFVSVLIGILVIGQAFVLSHVINSVFLENAQLANVTKWLVLLVTIIVGRSLLNMGHTVAAAHVAIHVKADLRNRLVTHILALGPTFTQRERTGELTLAATEGIDALDAFFRDYLPAMFLAVLLPLTILLVVLPLDLLTFAILLLTAPLIPIFMILIGRAAGTLAKQQYGDMSRMSAHFLDVMQGLPTLKLFNRSRHQIQTIDRITNQFRESTMHVLRLAFLSAFVLELLATISVAIVAVEVGLRLLAGAIGFEQALFLLIIAPEYYVPLRELGAKFHAGRDGTAAADRIYEVLDNLMVEDGGAQPPPQVMNIAFKNVACSYDDQRQALHDVTLTLQAGQTLALVGESGSGKSTIANLLLRFIAPDSGQITVDEIDLQTIDPKLWRECIAWVPQRPYLFNETVATNIRIGKPTASLSEVMAAAQAAHAHEFIMTLEHGYDTVVGEQGTRLSGGQAQRIAIARALLRDAPLVILDEATANLDALTEHAVMEAITELIKDRTVLIIAHHLDTIQQVDHILVMHEGRIIQAGTHAALSATDGMYRQLVETYSEGDDD